MNPESFIRKEKPQKDSDEKNVSRRDFLKKSGKLLGGAMAAGSAYDSLKTPIKKIQENKQPPRKIEVELFLEKQLLAEIQSIREKWKEGWEEEVKKRVKRGLEILVASLDDADTGTNLDKRLYHIFPLPVPKGFIEGTVLGVLNDIAFKGKPGVTAEDFNKYFLFGTGLAVALRAGKETKDYLTSDSPKNQRKKAVALAEGIALRALDLRANEPDKVGVTPEMIALKKDIADSIAHHADKANLLYLKKIGITTPLEKWGAAAYPVAYEMLTSAYDYTSGVEIK